MPAASIPRDAASWAVAALVLEQDTIPKPDGLGMRGEELRCEQISNNPVRDSTLFDFCSSI
jgi:hypothetical protein